MPRRLAVLAASVAALSLTLAGCSAGDPVAWAEKVCGSMEPEIKKLTTPAQVDPTDPVKAKDAMSAYLGSAAGAMGNMVNSMESAGDPPVDGGGEAVDKVTAALNNAKSAFEEAKSTLDGADTSDPAKVQAAFMQVTQDMSSIEGMDNPTAEFDRNPELQQAFNEAESCQRIEKSGP